MGKRLIVIIFIGCFLVGIGQKQSYADSTLSMNGLRGEYFDNSNLTNLKLSRDDSQIDFNWGLASPDASIDADTFSIRWTGSIIPRYSESYQFYMAADDGVRLWINNQLILDSWMDHAAELTSRQIALTAGTKYDIRVEYYENQGAAVASLQWSSKSQIKEVVPESQLYLPSKANGTGLKGEYYDNVDLTNLKLTRTDAQVEFAWAAESPDPSIEADTFSVRWSGYVVPKYTEEYTFYMLSDDGVRIWVNNQLILDKWEDQANELTSIPIQLTAGQRYEIRVEYFENTGHATAALKWSSAKELKTVIPQSALFPPDNVSGTGLKGEYYDNVDLTNLKLTRTDAQVEFAWAAESPDPTIEADTFSVRWSGYVVPKYTEEYTFYMLSDDGVRIWVNNQLILDKWEDQANELTSIPIQLTAGQRYEIRVEYFENLGNATAILKWSSASETKTVIPQSALFPPDSVSGTGLKGEYYDNVDLTNLKLTRTDAQVEFAWAAESPDPSIEADTFSVRWSGYVVPKYTEEYTFYMLSDDGVRIWVNNQLILDKWENQANELASVPIRLTANQRYEIRIEYFENTGHAAAALKWSSPSEAKNVISQANLYPNMERDNDNKIKYNYDAQGKVITIKSKTGEMIYYYYDLNGNLLRKEK